MEDEVVRRRQWLMRGEFLYRVNSAWLILGGAGLGFLAFSLRA